MTEITFEHLPQAVSQVYNKLENIERLLSQINKEQQTEPDKWFDIHELCSYLPDKPKIPTIYGKVHRLEIPFHKGEGQKKLRFRKSEIDSWLSMGKNKTISEIEAEADNYLK